jgi:uncharacterized protein (DUF2384 family)
VAVTDLRPRNPWCRSPNEPYIGSKEPTAVTTTARSGSQGAKAKPSLWAKLVPASGKVNYIALFRAAPMERIEIVKARIPATDAKRILLDLNVSVSLLDLPVSTFNRKVKKQEVLAQEASERIVGLAKLVGQVQAMVEESGEPEGFDAKAWTARWLSEPLPALGGVAPGTLLDTMEGQTLVSQALARIQSGAYA